MAITHLEPNTAAVDFPSSTIRFSDRGSISEALISEVSRVGQSSAAIVELDFSNIERLSSLDLAALIKFCLAARNQDKRVVLTHVEPVVATLLELTQFVRLAELRC